MTVYIDFPKYRPFGKLMRGMRPSSHMMADSLQELHEFAESMGIKRCWFDSNRRHPHYDLTGERLERVLEVLAPVSSKEMLRKVNGKAR